MASVRESEDCAVACAGRWRRLRETSRSIGMKRREFIELSAKSIGGALVYSLAGDAMIVNAQEGTVKVPLRFFTEQEAKVIIAACERIFPADESGPGATQAGAMVYIDRQLAGPYGTDKYRYT